MFAFKERKGNATVEVVACGGSGSGLRRDERGNSKRNKEKYLPEVFGEEDGKMLVWTEGGGGLAHDGLSSAVE